jgi:hypothetical protein
MRSNIALRCGPDVGLNLVQANETAAQRGLELVDPAVSVTSFDKFSRRMAR